MKKLFAILITILLCLEAFPSFLLAADIATIKVTPLVSCIKLGETITFNAAAYDENGSIISGVGFDWILSGVGIIISSNATTATYKAQSPGKATITAVAGGKSGSISFTVGSPKVSNVKIRVDPDIAGEVADYFITFETDECGILEPGDKIYIAFPLGTIFPRYYQCNILTVNGIPASFEVSEDSDDTPVLIITVPNGMPSVTYIYIRICKVINPRGGACYLIAVATSKQPHWSISNPYGIRGSIITPPDVTVIPNIVGEIAEYTIKFKTSSSGRLSSCYGGFVVIEFPYGTYVPQDISVDAVTVNGVVCTSSKPSVEGRVVKIYPGMVVLEDSDVTVKFTLEAGIRNPEKPDDYTLTVYTSSDTIHVESRPYKIMSSKIEDVIVTVDKPYINTPSAYIIKFKTGLVGKLNIGAQITIYFPQTTTLPKSGRAGDIIVNNVPTIKPPLIEGAFTLIIFTPVEILPKSEVTIFIPEEFGIINPPDPRRYKLEVHTAKEGTNVPSNEYMIGTSVIGELTVSLSLPYVGTSSDINLSFKTGGGGRLTKEKDRIFITFPKGSYIPNYIDKNNVTIQNKPLEINPFIKKESNEIILNVPEDIPANTKVNVHFSKNANILNPKTPGEYSFSVATSREVSYVRSPNIQITESSLKNVKIKLSSDTVLERSNFELSFNIGEAGALTKGDKINIYFSKGFKIPSNYEKGIFLNNDELNIFEVLYNPDLLKVQIEVNRDFLPDELVVLQFTEDAQIENPRSSGFYNIGVSTSKETKIVATDDFKIIPLPTTTIIINPTIPDGENDWYKSEPTILFQVSSENRLRVKTFYSFDGKDFIEYTNSFTLSSGVHELYFYSSHGKYAKEEVKKYIFKVDTIFPIIQLDEKTKIYTNKAEFTLSFTVIESNLLEVKVQNKVFQAFSGNVNTILELNEGENIISIIAKDLAGNTSYKEIIVVLDTVPPFIEVTKPLPWSRHIRRNITIEGKTSPDAIIHLNGKPLPNENGSFGFNYSLSPGLNSLTFEAIDLAGNNKIYYLPVTYYPNFTLKLFIGTNIAETSFGKFVLDAPIYIKGGYTFVPLRFFAELLTCEISFEPIFQIITITDPYGKKIVMQVGNRTVTINEDKTSLPASPEIKNGRTFVPLRFIAEEFSFQVNYVKEDNTVIMIYNGD